MAESKKPAADPEEGSADQPNTSEKETYEFTQDRPIWINLDGEDKILSPGGKYRFAENSYIADLVTHGILKKVNSK